MSADYTESGLVGIIDGMYNDPSWDTGGQLGRVQTAGEILGELAVIGDWIGGMETAAYNYFIGIVVGKGETTPKDPTGAKDFIKNLYKDTFGPDFPFIVD